VGPPGVGKTSLGKSIARAMGRNFVRISLGGVRDEAEIRGHRRTYIGSMPGRIIQSMKRAKSINPVFLLDEIDKMSVDFRGDPASALLEVLDPEQNGTFNDHYLDLDYDLSDVFFITTANIYEAIPEPLLDRLEVIYLPGYMEHEKIKIAEGFLVPKQIAAHGLTANKLQFTSSGIQTIIRQYTREAGVRSLERKIATICRKVARKIVENKQLKNIRVGDRQVAKFLGVPIYSDRLIPDKTVCGMATGLAWTRFGGDILRIEVTTMQGKGNLTLTGNLGEVMQESAKAAFSYIRSHFQDFELLPDFHDKLDIHVHVPEGAIPKDGPSAGVTIATAILSAVTKKQVRQNIAMTGEITLQGNVLAIGGLNEKIMAARRIGLQHVLVPKENEKDLQELPADLKRGLKISLIENLHQVFDHVIVTD
jgi:ATP-dependent Lon protease